MAQSLFGSDAPNWSKGGPIPWLHGGDTRPTIRKLEGNKLLAGGAELDEVCRHLKIAKSTWHRWLAQCGGMKASDAKRLKELEVENTRLKKLLAESELDKAMLKELAEGTSEPEPSPRWSRAAPGTVRGLRAQGVCGRRPASLHPAPGRTDSFGRRAGLAGVPACLLQGAPEVGLAPSGQGAAPLGLAAQLPAGPAPEA